MGAIKAADVAKLRKQSGAGMMDCKNALVEAHGDFDEHKYIFAGNFVVSAQVEFEKEGLNIAHYDMRFAKPLDENLLHKIFTKFDNIITIEDGCLLAGFGSAILEFMANNDYKSSVKRLGIPDEFLHHGTQEELHKEYFYDKSAIVKTVHEILTKKLISKVG